MIDLDQLAQRAVESPVGPPPSMNRIRALQKHRARRARAGRGACAFVVVAVTAAAVYTVTRGDSSHTRIVTPAQEQPSPSTTSPLRPVLDDCTATSAAEATVVNSPFTAPRAPAEVFADSARGASGPLAAVLRRPGNGTPQPPDGSVGGLIPNDDVQGREANFQMSTGLQGGASWDLADGGSAMVYSRGLTLDELHVFVSQIDAGTTGFPQGLQSVGTTATAQTARSVCTDARGLIAQIREVTGSLASRYAEMISTTEGANTFDTDHSSIAIEPFPGKFDPADAKYHQATREEWARLLRADPRLGVTPDTESPGTARSAAPTTLPVPVTGQEVTLSEVTTTESDRLVDLMQRDQPSTTDFVVLQIPDRAAVVVYRDGSSHCMTVADHPVAAAGDQGACISEDAASQQIFGVLDTGPVELPTTLAYGVWAAVPPGTAFVTTTYGTQVTWQRPIQGISYFTLPGAQPALGAEPVTMRAYDAQGNQLGQATRTPHQDGLGNWAW
jgi:hypothetical protein